MSLVGPRPERPELQKEIEKEVPEFGLRLQAMVVDNSHKYLRKLRYLCLLSTVKMTNNINKWIRQNS